MPDVVKILSAITETDEDDDPDAIKLQLPQDGARNAVDFLEENEDLDADPPHDEEPRTAVTKCFTAPTNSQAHFRSLAAARESNQPQRYKRLVDGLVLAGCPLVSRRRMGCISMDLQVAQESITAARLEGHYDPLVPLTEAQKGPPRGRHASFLANRASQHATAGADAGRCRRSSGGFVAPVADGSSGGNDGVGSTASVRHMPSATERYDRSAAAAAVAAVPSIAAMPSACARYESFPGPTGASKIAVGDSEGPRATWSGMPPSGGAGAGDGMGDASNDSEEDDDGCDVFDTMLTEPRSPTTEPPRFMSSTSDTSSCLTPTSIGSPGRCRQQLQPVTPLSSTASFGIDPPEEVMGMGHSLTSPAFSFAVASTGDASGTGSAVDRWRSAVAAPHAMNRSMTLGNPARVGRRRAAGPQQLTEAARTASMNFQKSKTQRSTASQNSNGEGLTGTERIKLMVSEHYEQERSARDLVWMPEEQEPGAERPARSCIEDAPCVVM